MVLEGSGTGEVKILNAGRRTRLKATHQRETWKCPRRVRVVPELTLNTPSHTLTSIQFQDTLNI